MDVLHRGCKNNIIIIENMFKIPVFSFNAYGNQTK